MWQPPAQAHQCASSPRVSRVSGAALKIVCSQEAKPMQLIQQWPQQLLTAPSWQLAAADFMRLAHACVAGSSCSEFALRNSHLAAAHPC